MIRELVCSKKKWVQLTEKNEARHVFLELGEQTATFQVDDIIFKFTSYEIIDDHVVLKINDVIVFIIKARNAVSLYCMMIDEKKIVRSSVLY